MSSNAAAQSPTVSVIVPVHNEMPHLTETIESVFTQELTDFELIAIDDGSSDGSGEELERLARSDDRLVVIRQPGSGWPGGPRNRGLERASGRYVFFLDGDDKLETYALGTMVAAFVAADADPVPVDVVIPKMRGTGGRRISPLFLRYPSGDIALDRAMETLTPQKMIRREMIEREGLRFPEGVVRLEDGIFMTQAYTAARRITYSGKRVLYLFAKRDRGGNTSSQLFRPEDYVDSCRVIATTLVENVADSEEAARLVSEFFGKMGLRFYTPRRWRLSHPWRRRAWVRAHRQFLADFVPEELDGREAHPTDRAKRALIRDGRVRGLSALIDAERRLDHGAELIAAEGDDELDLVVEL
ncbi:glycosyltransferase family A protein, partial [uncultured Agrococcus sp.]|uniref:glycosyltransferase family 2 protein n=1 Tax=uncultured Agrococcus sp. TaxID=382258 RepID=UPI0025F8B169